MSQSSMHGQRTLCKHEEILVVGDTHDTDDASRVSREPQPMDKWRTNVG